MAIYTLFSGLSAKSGLGAPFSPAWCKIVNITWGGDRSTFDTKAGTAGVISLDNVQLTKAVDGASTQLLKNELAGAFLNYVNIAITDGSNKTVIAFKLTNVVVTSGQFTAADTTNEIISLGYRTIAMATLTAGALDPVIGYDLAANVLTTPSGFTLDPTYGIKIA